MTQPSPDAVTLRGITKRFPGVLANADISLSVGAGEIHALMGENGAGKSTLMSILYGLYQPDYGQFAARAGRVVRSPPRRRSPPGSAWSSRTSPCSLVDGDRERGLRREPTRRGCSRRAARDAVPSLIAQYGLRLDPPRVGAPGRGAAAGRDLETAVPLGPVLILDEPTAVLTPAETARLFNVLRELAAAGNTVLFVSHKLQEVLEVSDNVTVLRDGSVTCSRARPHTPTGRRSLRR